MPTSLNLFGIELPTQSRLSRVFEHRYRPERARLRRMLLDFIEQAPTLPDQHVFWQTLEIRLREGLCVEWLLPIIRTINPRFFSTDSRLPAWFIRHPRPLELKQALNGHHTAPFSPAEREWLQVQQPGLIVPLVLHNELIGILVIGPPEAGREYHPDCLAVLTSLMPQVARAWEKLNLLQETVEKKRRERELEMARRTQEALLPRKLPVTPGLEVAAACRFCLEVAGDYYDLIPLGDSRTAIAIADVCGKGAAAAILMSALKAALHTALRLKVAPAEVLAGANALIHQNTRPEQFITCFLAVFDPATCSLDYVNAAHSPPILIRQGSRIESFDKGGLALGVMPDWTYESGRVQLQSGDYLLLYTDGVTEAANLDGEMFGDERLCRILAEADNSPLPQLLSEIELAVELHHGSPSYEDDFTLVLMRPV